MRKVVASTTLENPAGTTRRSSATSLRGRDAQGAGRWASAAGRARRPRADGDGLRHGPPRARGRACRSSRRRRTRPRSSSLTPDLRPGVPRADLRRAARSAFGRRRESAPSGRPPSCGFLQPLGGRLRPLTARRRAPSTASARLARSLRGRLGSRRACRSSVRAAASCSRRRASSPSVFVFARGSDRGVDGLAARPLMGTPPNPPIASRSRTRRPAADLLAPSPSSSAAACRVPATFSSRPALGALAGVLATSCAASPVELRHQLALPRAASWKAARSPPASSSLCARAKRLAGVQQPVEVGAPAPRQCVHRPRRHRRLAQRLHLAGRLAVALRAQLLSRARRARAVNSPGGRP